MRQKEQVQKSFAKIFFDSALASMMRLEKTCGLTVELHPSHTMPQIPCADRIGEGSQARRGLFDAPIFMPQRVVTLASAYVWSRQA